jgi:uncharacterized protein (TIGR02284 family)
MNHDKKTAHTLNDLIEIARDGSEFYAEAAGKVDNPELASLFQRMGAHKREIAAGLAADVSAAGAQPAEHGTMVGSMRQVYAKARAAFGDTSYAYVAELEELEDRLLDAFKDTLEDSDTPAAARAAAQKYMPRVTECHDIMRNRKMAMKNAG